MMIRHHFRFFFKAPGSGFRIRNQKTPEYVSGSGSETLITGILDL